MNVGIAVHRYAANEGTGGYVVELLPRIAQVHQVTLYAAEVSAPVPEGVQVVRVPATMHRAYAGILTFPMGLRLVRRPHHLFHAQGWITSSADVVTAHIVLAAWRDAARRQGAAAPIGERMLGRFVQGREASLLRQAARVIAPSAKVRDEIALYYGRTQGVIVVRHGFPQLQPPAKSEARRQLGLPAEAIVALFVGDPRKGFDVALDAVNHAPSVRLAVASHSPGAPLIERVAQAGMLDRFHWLGSLDRVSLALAAADFLLHPTIYDSFGLAVAEAMASGLPVVVTRAAGIAELIADQESGWIVGDPVVAGVRTAVAALARDRALRQRLGAGARAAASRRSWDDVAQETLAVYQEAHLP